jgi:hypothetical protein
LKLETRNWKLETGNSKLAHIAGPMPHVRLLSLGVVRILAGGILLALCGAGCRVVQSAAEVPGQAVRTVTSTPKEAPPPDPVDMQQNLARLANEFISRMVLDVDKLSYGTNALSAAERLRWKLALGTATCTIVSGPNITANVLDMTVFISEMRASLEEHWKPRVFGDSVDPLLENCRLIEAALWRLSEKVLKPEQQAELREAIKVWHQQESKPENVLVVRAAGLALQVSQSKQAEASKPGSLFSLLMLDPLSNLDPTRREMAQARLFAERALYVAQKMPTLLRWQTELLTANTLEQPALQQWSTNVTQIAASVDRLTRVAEQLPQQVSAEREAILKALESQERDLKPLLSEARQTLTAGTELSAAMNTTLNTFDGVMKRLGVGEPKVGSPASTNAEPFRIQNYGQAAVQLEAAARQLTVLLQTFEQTLGANSRTQLVSQISPVVQQAQAGGRELVDYAFQKALLFVAVVLLAALLYRLLATWLSSSRSKQQSPK